MDKQVEDKYTVDLIKDMIVDLPFKSCIKVNLNEDITIYISRTDNGYNLFTDTKGYDKEMKEYFIPTQDIEHIKYDINGKQVKGKEQKNED